jgi:hypothetical protein
VQAQHLGKGAFQSENFAKQSVDGSIIATSSIGSDHIVDGALTPEKIALSAINGGHIADEAIASEHISAGSIRLHHLSKEFVPLALGQRALTLELFGVVPFHFAAKEKRIEVVVEFNQAFADENYAIVAMTSDPTCYAVLKERTREAALIELIRTRLSPEAHSIMTWVAMGKRE